MYNQAEKDHVYHIYSMYVCFISPVSTSANDVTYVRIEFTLDNQKPNLAEIQQIITVNCEAFNFFLQ